MDGAFNTFSRFETHATGPKLFPLAANLVEYLRSWVSLLSIVPVTRRAEQRSNIYTIFEGTSEIQRLIIARAISGVHIR